MGKQIVNVTNTAVISKQVTEYASQFKIQARKTAEGVLEMAKVVYDAKQLSTLDFEAFCYEVGYASDSSTIRKLKSIGEKYQFLLARSKSLPASWTTLYQVSRLTAEVIEQKIDEGVINPQIDGKSLSKILGVEKPSEAKSVPKGTKCEMNFSVDIQYVPSMQVKQRLKLLLEELEKSMKVVVTKSATLEDFLKDSSTTVAQAA